MPDKRVQKTKKLIVDSFIKLSKDKDIFHISIKNICDEANINRGTFYFYYQDYVDFLDQLKNNMSKDIIDIILQYRFDTDSSKVVRDMVEYYYQNADVLTIFVQNNDYFRMEDYISNIIWQETLPHWLEESDIDEDEATLLYAYIMSGSQSLMLKWVERGFSMPKERVEELLANLVKYGLYNYVYTK